MCEMLHFKMYNTLYSLDSLPTELWGAIKTNNSTGVEDNIVQFLLESSLLLLCHLINHRRGLYRRLVPKFRPLLY